MSKPEPTYEEKKAANLKSIQRAALALADEPSPEGFAKTLAQLGRLKTTRKKLNGLTADQRNERNETFFENLQRLTKEREAAAKAEREKLEANNEVAKKAKMPRP